VESWQQKISKFRLLLSDGTQHLENCETHFHEIFGTATEMFTHNNGNLTFSSLGNNHRRDQQSKKRV
jgi:hypothetical protein